MIFPNTCDWNPTIKLNPAAYVFGKLVMMIEFCFLGFRGRRHHTVQRSQQAAASHTVALPTKQNGEHLGILPPEMNGRLIMSLLNSRMRCHNRVTRQNDVTIAICRTVIEQCSMQWRQLSLHVGESGEMH